MISLSSRPLRLVAAVLVTAAAGLTAVATASPASAAACTTTTGVTVVADFNQLGGGVRSVCVGDGAGQDAWSLFDTAGLPLTPAQRQPGFVCRVAGVPTSDPCVNTSPSNAYWGLWWSDGNAGSGWIYSSLGASSLKIPAGGLVAFSWDETNGDATPSASSTRPAAAPTSTPTSAPTSTPSGTTSGGSGSGSGSGSGNGSGGGTSGSGPAGGSGTSGSGGSTPTPDAAPTSVPTNGTETSAPGTPTPSDFATKKPGKRSGDRPTSAPSEETDEASAAPETETAESPETTEADPALVDSDAAADDDNALAGWVAPALIVLLFGGAGAAWFIRRRGVSSP